jgi:chorismate--pyruvate lyase
LWHNFLVKILRSNQYQRDNCNFHWLKKPILSGRYRQWLQDEGSLTQRLRQRNDGFTVKPSLVAYGKPFFDELALLAIPMRSKALIREVFLMGGKQPLVFAHSVLPPRSIRGPWLNLRHLGNKPLGAKLFSAPKVRRMTLSYKKLAPHHVLYQHAIQGLDEKPGYLWARRSLFSLNCANIMVTEVFLPQILL